MRHPYTPSWLFRFAIRILKYFLLGLVGCTVAYFLSVVLGFNVLSGFLVVLLENWLMRLLVVVFSLGAIAVVTESLRY
ncbi:MAG: hypothetical protein F6K42_30880 [Leptolyngbya sp. SIO1D8]|nr:hypothetical protein [Leptolyngbya sp. SIO1D8]